MTLLGSNCQGLPAGIVENSYFFINTNKNSHFGQLDLVDIEIADVIAIVGSSYLALVTDV